MPDTKPDTNTLDTWQMCLSILTGVRKTLAQARAEHDAIMIAHPGKMMPPGASEKSEIITALMGAERQLDTDLYRIARSGNLPMIEKVRA